VDLVTMTKGQASVFIDGLKKLSEERGTYGDSARAKAPTLKAETPASAPARPADGTPINEKQIHAMERLAQQHNLNLDTKSRQRFCLVARDLTYEQAAALLRELQRPTPTRRSVNEPAL
jgi:hypothetical protein